MDNQVRETVRIALREDVGSGDLTAALIPVTARAHASLVARETAVLCGREWFDQAFDQVDPGVRIDWRVQEGDRIEADQLVCTIQGSARSILTAERTAINFLQTLSGTATATRRYVEKLEGLNTRVLDTRKTIPGLRLAQKYAARIGGATNHRVGLYDGVLIKENHIRAAGSITAALEQALRETPAGALLEVEVENLEELREAIAAGARRILLDNFSLAQMRAAVADKPGEAELEASGNITLETIREVAETGVDYISVGALSKHLRAIDFSLLFDLDEHSHG